MQFPQAISFRLLIDCEEKFPHLSHDLTQFKFFLTSASMHDISSDISDPFHLLSLSGVPY